jgi:hypothetical protein
MAGALPFNRVSGFAALQRLLSGSLVALDRQLPINPDVQANRGGLQYLVGYCRAIAAFIPVSAL